MQEVSKLPALSIDLIKWLDEKYPSRPPRLSTPDREIWYEAGQRSLVDNLLQLVREQEENILENI